jgi:type IV pilus assembly protein PilM
MLSDGVDEDGTRTVRALLVVAYRELVDSYIAACTQAGIELAGIDLEAFAMLRALGAPAPEGEVRDDGALVALCIGRERSTLAVSDGRICEFTRVLEWGGSDLTSRIADELGIDAQQAERVKRSLSLDPDKAPLPGPAPEREDEARQAALRGLQSFARELVSSLRFYQGQAGSLPIGEIVLTGGTAQFAGVAGQLERLIGVRVRVADPFARVDLPEGLERPAAPGSLTIAIGLGIDD